MKYILIEMPNELPDEGLDGLAEAIRKTFRDMELPAIIRFGSLFTSL